MNNLARTIQCNAEDGDLDVTNSLGIVKMPQGYALMVDPFTRRFYAIKPDGFETDPHPDRWEIYRWARDYSRASATVHEAPL
ncbi:hypothetical protein [Nevskia sp.]|uniref:hypothetical protein n=1 Tax=Nevskia sp. TaxID=1929292 RepID=UPI0025EEE4F8|nr:hypothetical protein [Nevskia sp.]